MIFQMNSMDWNIGGSWIPGGPEIANPDDYISATINKGSSEEDDFTYTKYETYKIKSDMIPRDGIYVSELTSYKNGATYISSYQISVDNRFGVKYAYRFNNTYLT